MKYKIHKEGYKTIAFFTSLLVLAIVLMEFFLTVENSSWYWVYAPLVFFLIMSLQFFRSPKRSIATLPDGVISPADGEVVVVEETREKEYFDKPMRQISIFMSPVNVHLNRYPISGKVLYYKYHPGKYLLAWNPKSSLQNERTSLALETEHAKPVFLRQVAGFLARRIVCYGQEGLNVSQGSELGFIKFGSRVDILLPLDAVIKVKPGDKVKGGITTLATFNA